jgi:16S rRNA (uracil1498-N3)-methyltransferase
MPRSKCNLYRLPRLYLGAAVPFYQNQLIALAPEHHHYLVHVLRMKLQDQLRVFNGCDGEWHAEIALVDKKKAHITLLEQLRPQEQARPVMLAVSIIKPTRFSWLIEKATELGVQRIQPIQAMRSQVKPMAPEKMHAIAIETAEQSERLTVPEILPPLSTHAFLQQEHTRLIAIADETQSDIVTLPALYTETTTPPIFLIGPEGGWHPEECAQFAQMVQEKKAVRIALGSAILRSETAAITCLSYTMLAFTK